MAGAGSSRLAEPVEVAAGRDSAPNIGVAMSAGGRCVATAAARAAAIGAKWPHGLEGGAGVEHGRGVAGHFAGGAGEEAYVALFCQVEAVAVGAAQGAGGRGADGGVGDRSREEVAALWAGQKIGAGEETVHWGRLGRAEEGFRYRPRRR